VKNSDQKIKITVEDEEEMKSVDSKFLKKSGDKDLIISKLE
jgi:hypothetical protein